MKRLGWYEDRIIVEGLAQRLRFNKLIAKSLQAGVLICESAWKKSFSRYQSTCQRISSIQDVITLDLQALERCVSGVRFQELRTKEGAFAVGYRTAIKSRIKWMRFRCHVVGVRMAGRRAMQQLLLDPLMSAMGYILRLLKNSTDRYESKYLAICQACSLDCYHVRRSILFLQLFTPADSIEEITGDAIELYERKRLKIGESRARDFMRRKAIREFFYWLARMARYVTLVKHLHSALS